MSSGQGWDALWYGFNKNKFCSCIRVWEIYFIPRKRRKKRKSKGHTKRTTFKAYSRRSSKSFRVDFTKSNKFVLRWGHDSDVVFSHNSCCFIWWCVNDDDVSFKTCCLARKTSAHAYSLAVVSGGLFGLKKEEKRQKKSQPKKPKVTRAKKT